MSSLSITRREQLKTVLGNICSIRTPEAVAAATKKAEESSRVRAYAAEYEKAQKIAKQAKDFEESLDTEIEVINDTLKGIIKNDHALSTFQLNVATYSEPHELETQIRGNEVIIGINLPQENGNYRGHEYILVSELIQDPLRAQLDLIKAGALDEMELCTTEKQIIELIRDVKGQVEELKK